MSRARWRIVLVTPAPPRSRAGNRATAVRWAAHLRNLGHRLTLAVDYDGGAYDLMIALHAWRSHESVARFRREQVGRPLLLALTGTDIYRFLHTDPAPTLASMTLADRLIVLNDQAHKTVPAELQAKVRLIYQSALPLRAAPAVARRTFDVCVIGHLREEKDPFRAAYAARALPADSRVRVVHLGKGHTPAWEQQARAEMQANPRYRWRGEVSFGEVRRLMRRARLMVLSSRMEGGANVISEACVARLPILASRIPGTVGLLGEDYPGYFPVEDTAALTALLLRAERDVRFYAALKKACAARAALFTPRAERMALQRLLSEFA